MKIPDLVALTCLEVTELANDFLGAELDADERACVEQHLYACTWCMTYLDQLRRTLDWTRQLGATEQASPDAREALLALFQRERSEPRR